MTEFLFPGRGEASFSLFRALIMVLFLMIAISGGVAADQDTDEAFIVIVGPGDPIYTYWGHIGIAIGNRFYDFGNFSFYAENFYTNFAMGRMLYLGMETPTDFFLSYSLRDDRDLMLYPLNLGPEEMEILENRLEWWMEPENREYLYDYFYDNCSTIIRDVLDEATRGALADASTSPTGQSFRHHARTGAHESAVAEILLHFLLGQEQDREISDWELMFLPRAVAESAMETMYTGSDGTARTLAGAPIVLRESTRPDVPDQTGGLWLILLPAGLMAALLWFYFTRYRGERKWLAVTGLVVRIFLILLIGLPGVILGFMMVFTDHAATYSNINIAPALPTILLALIPLAGTLQADDEKRRKLERRIGFICGLNLAALAIVIVIRAIGLSIQDAFAFWSFYLPFLAIAVLPVFVFRQPGKTIRDSASSGT